MGEGEQGLQEPGLPPAEGVGREGGALALGGPGRGAHGADRGPGQVHRRGQGRPLQAGHLPLLSGGDASCWTWRSAWRGCQVYLVYRRWLICRAVLAKRQPPAPVFRPSPTRATSTAPLLEACANVGGLWP